MSIKQKLFLIFILLIISILFYAESTKDLIRQINQSQVITYPGPETINPSTHYRVRVNNKTSFVYQTKVLNGKTASYTYFDFNGVVRIDISSSLPVNTVKVLPKSYSIKPKIKNNSISLILIKHANITLEINDSINHALHIFANPIEENPPQPEDPNVIYIKPGVHELSSITLKSNQTLYIAGGAYLKGILLPDERVIQREPMSGNPIYQNLISAYQAENIKIIGRGIIDMSGIPLHAKFPVWLWECSNFEIEGIIIQDTSFWHYSVFLSDNGIIDNVKAISYRINGDGIDLMHSSDIVVKNSFIRAGDDCIRVAANMPEKADVHAKNISINNCVIWNEFASGLGVTFNNTAAISDIQFINCDIIHDFTSHYHAGALSISAGDSSIINNVLFEDIRIEDSRQSLIYFWIGKDYHSIENARGRIKNIKLKDINYTGNQNPQIYFAGYDSSHRIDNIIIENLNYRNKILSSLPSDLFQISYTNNISIIRNGKKLLSGFSIPENKPKMKSEDLLVALYSFDNINEEYTITGNPQKVKGIKNSGMQFDYNKKYSYLELNSKKELEHIEQNNYTIITWYKPLSIPKGISTSKLPSHGIIMKAGYHIGLAYSQNKQFVLNHFLDGGQFAGTTSQNVLYEPGQFYFVAGVIERDAGMVKLYVNGILVGQNNFKPHARVQPLDSPWRIGIGAPLNKEYPFPAHGVIDEAAFYNNALTDEQIMQLYEKYKMNK